ncbi:Crp/Fnr family transcriptional regulator [Methylobacterium sp. A54F]
MAEVSARDAMPSSPDLPLNAFVRKLESSGTFSPDERKALLKLPVTLRVLSPRQDAVRIGDRPSHCFLVQDGWVCRYAQLSNGRRQITAFHVAGDLPDLQSLHLPVLDHSISTLTIATLAFIPHEPLHGIIAKFPNLAAALWRNALVDAAISREWIVSLGRRSAYQRLAHLLCELYLRQEAVGLADGHSCSLPLTQSDLADATGLTPVHVNRMLQRLRRNGLVRIYGGQLTVLRWTDLVAAAIFDESHLHLIRKQA